MLQQKLLGGCGQVKQLAITGKLRFCIFLCSNAVAAVVVQGRSADLIQLDSVSASPIIVGIGQQSDLAFSFKQVVGLRCKFGYKFTGHILKPQNSIATKFLFRCMLSVPVESIFCDIGFPGG